MPRSLARLAEDFALETRGAFDDVEVTGVAADPGDIEAGDLFVDVAGPRAAVSTAELRERGAVALLTDPAGAERAGDDLPVLVTAAPREAVGDVAAWVYRTTEHPPLLFAVTGTTGKTSVVHLLDALLGQLGVPTGFSSTAEHRAGDDASPAGQGEPDAAQLHALLARMRENGVRAAAIEVSAQALTDGRVAGLEFDVVGFTNLAADQLSDYPDMEAYLAAKQNLFDPDRARRGVVDVDGDWGRRVADESRIPVASVATTPGVADWTVTVDAEDQLGSDFTLVGPGGTSISARVPLVGRFMATNAALAIVMLVESGFELEAIGHAIQQDGGIPVTVPGRAERVSGEGSPAVYLDAAASAGALRTTLRALRAATPGRLLAVVPLAEAPDPAALAEAAAEEADVVVLTDFPPGFPRPSAAEEAARGAAGTVLLHEIPDPRQALRLAISLAEPGDSVLRAGPEHQHHQETSDVKHAYTARDDARLALQEAGWSVAS
ncbi:Mur ligase family protein [Naasia sp. SYSU D00948]|uniref:Mur ligase family protein n=1 Tax=Naasia sp. SYSU D00948 TaxID=2817379 RepID=UPI0027DC8532|nr:Mur ligase family protein [Naasia sp. SYSU D00948]